MNVFTYKYFSSKAESLQTLAVKNDNPLLTSKAFSDSLTKLSDQLYDAKAFTLDNNDRAKNYLNQNDIPAFEEKVKQALLTYNDDREGNKYTGQIKMGEQKYIINSMKILNHRWIIADYSNGVLWGEVMLKYFVNDDQTISFEIMDSYLYPKELN
jgi:hypothetical protein